MKIKKEFFSVLLSVIICVLLAFVITYAATSTIGEAVIVGTDLTVTSGARIGTGTTPDHITALGDDSFLIEGIVEVDGIGYFDSDVAVRGSAAPATELSVVGTASISEDLWASGSFQMGGGEGVATLSYSRLGSATTGHSLSNSNDLMISGDIEIDGTAYFDGVASVSDTNGLMIGGGASLYGGTASPDFNCVQGSWYFRAGQNASSSIYFCGATNTWDPMIMHTTD